MSELWCQHALGCKTQRAGGRGCAALRIWRCSPAPADRRGAPGARARPHTSRGRPRRLGRARRRSGVRSRPSRARIRHEDEKSLLHDNEQHGGRAALLRGHALHKPAPAGIPSKRQVPEMGLLSRGRPGPTCHKAIPGWLVGVWTSPLFFCGLEKRT